MGSSHQDNDPIVEIETLQIGPGLNIETKVIAMVGLYPLHSKPRVPLNPSSEVIFYHVVEPSQDI